MIETNDILRKTAKYILVGTFTWPSKMSEDNESEDEDPKEKDEEIGPQIDDPEPEVDIRAEDEDQRKLEEEWNQFQEEEEERLQRQGTKVPDIEYEPTEPGEDVKEEEVNIQVHRMAVPLPGRSGDELLKGVSELYLTLKSEGKFVQQIHADRGGEFAGKKMEKWCLERGLLQTFTPGADPQGNGRCERAVQAVKTEARKLLRAANVGPEMWPFAVRYLNETWRRKRVENKEVVPPFMSEVITRRRYWKTQDMEPRNEKVTYLHPSWMNHGHWIKTADGAIALTRAVITGTRNPESSEVWIALEDRWTPYEERRRLREKVQVRRYYERTAEEQQQDKVFEEMVQKEAMHLVSGDPGVAPIVADALRMFQETQDDTPEAEILQTKIVSPAEVKKKVEHWKKAIEAEIEALFVKTGALKKVSAEEMKRLEKAGAVPLPSKVVFTVKPDPQQPQGKKKRRIVACGNYAPPDENADYFAAGADATSLRMALSSSARQQWIGINLDVKTAFLNASMNEKEDLEESEEEEGEHLPILLWPPRILTVLGYFQPGEGWSVEKALYGFRQSPKRLSTHRDARLTKMRVQKEWLCQLDSESCVWLIKSGTEDEVLGMILTYVDDLLVLAEESRAKSWVDVIRSTWETSEPEIVKDGKSTRFLGMELLRTSQGKWVATQEGYSTDLLIRNLGPDPKTWGHKKTPIAREEDDGEAPEVRPKEEMIRDIRECQRIVGELICGLSHVVVQTSCMQCPSWPL